MLIVVRHTSEAMRHTSEAVRHTSEAMMQIITIAVFLVHWCVLCFLVDRLIRAAIWFSAISLYFQV